MVVGIRLHDETTKAACSEIDMSGGGNFARATASAAEPRDGVHSGVHSTSRSWESVYRWFWVGATFQWIKLGVS